MKRVMRAGVMRLAQSFARERAKGCVRACATRKREPRIAAAMHGQIRDDSVQTPPRGASTRPEVTRTDPRASEERSPPPFSYPREERAPSGGVGIEKL